MFYIYVIGDSLWDFYGHGMEWTEKEQDRGKIRGILISVEEAALFTLSRGGGF